MPERIELGSIVKNGKTVAIAYQEDQIINLAVAGDGLLMQTARLYNTYSNPYEIRFTEDSMEILKNGEYVGTPEFPSIVTFAEDGSKSVEEYRHFHMPYRSKGGELIPYKREWLEDGTLKEYKNNEQGELIEVTTKAVDWDSGIRKTEVLTYIDGDWESKTTTIELNGVGEMFFSSRFGDDLTFRDPLAREHIMNAQHITKFSIVEENSNFYMHADWNCEIHEDIVSESGNYIIGRNRTSYEINETSEVSFDRKINYWEQIEEIHSKEVLKREYSEEYRFDIRHSITDIQGDDKTLIEYFENGRISYIGYSRYDHTSEQYEFHREDGEPARTFYYSDGSLRKTEIWEEGVFDLHGVTHYENASVPEDTKPLHHRVNIQDPRFHGFVKQFAEENWKTLDLGGKKELLEKWVSYNCEFMGIEATPTLIITPDEEINKNAQKNTRFMANSRPVHNVIELNEIGLDNGFGVMADLSHECAHFRQFERKLKPQCKQDYEMGDAWREYKEASKCGPKKYYEQLPEGGEAFPVGETVMAYAETLDKYGSKFSDRIQKTRDVLFHKGKFEAERDDRITKTASRYKEMGE